MSLRSRSRSRIALYALTCLAVAACGDNDPTGPDVEGPENGSLTANIDGQSFAATFVTSGGGVDILGIGGSQGDISMGLGMLLNQGTGTQTFGVGVPANAHVSIGGVMWSAGSGSGSGSITITSITEDEVRGTFNFVGAATDSGATPQTRTITNGAFRIDL